MTAPMATKWTANDVPDQSGRVVVVTGANSGIGLHAARELARRGAKVVMACRDLEKAHRAEHGIRDDVPSADLEVRALDLASLASVRRFAEELPHDRIDVLLNNAGVMAIARQETEDGFEKQLGTNHLGHFALTGLLLERLQAVRNARVVTVSSTAHKTGRMSFDNLQGTRRYNRWLAYGQSKLANLLFALELQRRAAAAGADLRSIACHPGYSATQLQSHTPNPVERLAMGFLNRTVAQSDAMGALPSLYAATVPDVPGGSFIGPDGPAEMRGNPIYVQPNGRARDEASAQRLWDESERLTGVSYGFVH